MSAKALSNKINVKSQDATLLGPGDFPLGSAQSRAAARLRLQITRIGGQPASDCICFPEDERPSFGFPSESEIASKVMCPVHGASFTPSFHLYVAKRFREKLSIDLRTRHSEQYRKAWLARFPAELWPAQEDETDDGTTFLHLKDGTRLLGYEPFVTATKRAETLRETNKTR
jgi:hypothetical protein